MSLGTKPPRQVGGQTPPFRAEKTKTRTTPKPRMGRTSAYCSTQLWAALREPRLEFFQVELVRDWVGNSTMFVPGMSLQPRKCVPSHTQNWASTRNKYYNQCFQGLTMSLVMELFLTMLLPMPMDMPLVMSVIEFTPILTIAYGNNCQGIR